MTTDAAREAANLLHRARMERIPLAHLPEGCRPADVEAARDVQEAWVELAADSEGWAVAGYKIGCTSREAQEMLGAEGPFPGRIFSPFVWEASLNGMADLPAGQVMAPKLEGEFAFRLGDGLPARDGAYGREEVAAAVAGLHPAVEIIDPRWTEWLSVGLASIVADQGANGGLVLGAAVDGWRDLDIAVQSAAMSINSEETGRGTGADVLGHPLDALTWLANDLSRRGFGLEAGQVVTTGTMTSVAALPAGSMGRCDYGDLGVVEVRYDRRRG